ncbi:hypothetical protein JCM10908_001491 [Rhodotorula pacifica]|uniref:Efg1p n=1 Tax=Rhodotorula pacifica TaxID=1495444 RepID=UPI003179A7CB
MAEGYSSNPTRGARGRGGAGGAGNRGGSSSSSSSRPRQSHPRHNNNNNGTADTNAIPAGSVSKLKAQIRQTKRLLAREDLTPDVRTTTERRMVALESELEKTSQSKVEKKMVQRYRGVKFFERQKLLRKIKQARKQLADVPESADAQRALLEARIDLYYVLRYPRSEKYIALFPDGTYVPALSSLSQLAKDAAPSERKRQSLRIALREQVESGQLPAEAELGELGIEGEEDVGSGPGKAVVVAKGKRARSTEEDDDEERAKSASEDDEPDTTERPAKRTRSSEAADVEAPAAPTTTGGDASTTGGKKEKENRKQRKERKRAEAEAGVTSGTKGNGTEQEKKGASGKKPAAATADLAAEDDFFA